MKWLLRLVGFCFAVAIVFCALIIGFGVSNKPEVIGLGWEFSHKDIARAKEILREGAEIKPGELGTLEFTESDLNLAANYLLNRYCKSAVYIQLVNNKMRFNVTLTLPDNYLGKYFNVSFRIGNDEGDYLPKITKFKVGKLLLPARLSAWIIQRVIHYTALRAYYLLATEPIEAVEIDQEKVAITYFSSVESLNQARKILSEPNTNPAQTAYRQKLIEVVKNHDPEWRLSLAELLQPVFQLARQRSTEENAVEENRLAIMTVNEFVNRQEIPRILAGKPADPKTHSTNSPFMYKRIDLAQHFIGAAALTASLNKQVASVMAEEKELSDAESGGSGFSFIDLAADKAGTKFGEVATASPQSARHIQVFMSSIKSYSEFMPDPRDLPEKMDEAEFKKRFGSIDSGAYRDISQEIDLRILRLPIYQKPWEE